jgi:hypothetical protein
MDTRAKPGVLRYDAIPRSSRNLSCRARDYNLRESSSGFERVVKDLRNFNRPLELFATVLNKIQGEWERPKQEGGIKNRHSC